MVENNIIPNTENVPQPIIPEPEQTLQQEVKTNKPLDGAILKRFGGR